MCGGGPALNRHWVEIVLTCSALLPGTVPGNSLSRVSSWFRLKKANLAMIVIIISRRKKVMWLASMTRNIITKSGQLIFS